MRALFGFVKCLSAMKCAVAKLHVAGTILGCCNAQMQSRSGAATLDDGEGGLEGVGADLSRQVRLVEEKSCILLCDGCGSALPASRPHNEHGAFQTRGAVLCVRCLDTAFLLSCEAYVVSLLRQNWHKAHHGIVLLAGAAAARGAGLSAGGSGGSGGARQAVRGSGSLFRRGVQGHEGAAMCRNG